jgi:hypothetical protein
MAVLLTMVKEAEMTQNQIQHRVCTRTVRSLLTGDEPDANQQYLKAGLCAYLDEHWNNAIYEEEDASQTVLAL